MPLLRGIWATNQDSATLHGAQNLVRHRFDAAMPVHAHYPVRRGLGALGHDAHPFVRLDKQILQEVAKKNSEGFQAA
jgi:hypothetical protein